MAAMQVSSANDVKVYNLSAGKSLPDWLEDRERRRRAGKASSGDARRSIQLLQDLEMPVVSDRVAVSTDGNFLCAIGTYKPRIRCYELAQLGMKFERCFDSEAVAFELLSDDYSKMAFLHCDRYVEVHAQFGRYYRLRIPNFGRDLAYHAQTCDVYFAGDSASISRLNLEQGRFLSPYETSSAGSNVCIVNPEHQLLLVGTVDGAVEAWDPRSRQRVGRLDCLQGLDLTEVERMPEISALACRDALNLAVGTTSGHVQLFDLRSPKPHLVKDHMYGVPIKKVVFHKTYDQVLSLDAKGVKIWDRQTGKPFTAIESEHELNDLAVFPGSGLLVLANEQPRMQVHFLPALGPAPAWCSFLDNLTEEMEENEVAEVYDDYKFVTKEKLSDLGLDHLIGSDLLRAYMHGYFMDIRLFRKAESLAKPAGQESKTKKKIEEERRKRVTIKQNLPNVNRDLYLKLKEAENGASEGKKKKSKALDASLLADERFGDMFKDERFAIDTTEEAYRLLNPVLSKLDESRMQKLKGQYEEVEEEPSHGDTEGSGLDSDIYSDSDSGDGDESEEEELSRPTNKKPQALDVPANKKSAQGGVKFYELKDGYSGSGRKSKKDKESLEKRLEWEKRDEGRMKTNSQGGHQMTFARKESRKQVQEKMRKEAHMAERAKLRRSTQKLKNKKKGFS